MKGVEKRITTLSLFKSGIAPAFEDPANKEGADIQIRIENLNDMELLNQKWKDMVIALVSGEFPNTDKVTGIRIVDKSRAGSEQMRFEIWLSANAEDSEEVKQIKQFLDTNFVAKLANSKLQWNKH